MSAARVEARAESRPLLLAGSSWRCSSRVATSIATAAESTGAPLALRDAGRGAGRGAGTPPRRDARPSARTRLGGIRWPAAGLVAGAVAVALAAVVLVGGGPGIEDVAAAAVRPPTAADRAGARGLARCSRSAWPTSSSPTTSASSAGRPSARAPTRSTGRDTRTVFYEKDGKRIAYTVVAGEALDEARRRPTGPPVEGTESCASLTLRRPRRSSPGRRRGQTCVLSVRRTRSRATSCSTSPAGRPRASSPSRPSAIPKRSRARRG